VKKFRLFALLFLVVCSFLPIIASAGDLIPERQMQKALLLSKALVVKIAARQQAGQAVAIDIVLLKVQAGEIAANHRILRERFVARDVVAGGLGPVASARQGAMREEYFAFIDEYLAAVTTLPDDSIPDYLLDALKSRLESLLPEHPVPLLGALPYRHLRLPSQLPAPTPTITPAPTPTITPAYLDHHRPFTPADLAGSPETPITPEIAALAQSLHWVPAQIYGWVKNNIKSEWYWGLMKGATETLHQKSGNDADQAALLVALLRASGYPARFVRGTIELFPTPAGVLAHTGVSDVQSLAGFFQKAGIPWQPVIKGGVMANLQIEHIWVETYISYGTSRGATVGTRDKTWLGLDTQIKLGKVTVKTPAPPPPSVDLPGLRDRYLTADRSESPLEYLRAGVTGAGVDYENLLHHLAIADQLIQIVPASLPFHLVAVSGEYTTLPESLTHRARFTASHGDTVMFDDTLPLADLSNRSLAITFEPSTVEDQEIINSYGGLGSTPAYLIHLRPVLTVDGERTLIGMSGLAVGSDFKLAVELIAPNHCERIENQLIIGNLAVLGLVAQQVVTPPELALGDKDAERLLHERALDYIDQWNRSENELAALLNLPLLRPMPTLVTVGGAVEVIRLLDTPHGFEWYGVYVDADFRAVELVGAADKQKTFTQLSGLQGSVLEARVLEEGFGVEAVSTAKLLGLSNGEGLPPLVLNRANLAAELPGLGLPANVAEDISNAVAQGLTVTIPPGPSRFEDWQGVGYLKEDPDSGEAGWMLSGSIAGGMTAWNPERWPLDAAAEVLANPFNDQPNRDSSAAMFIQKVTASDLQVGSVGQLLLHNLQVYVTDRNHKPVKGAPVTFKVVAGGGTLAGQVTQTVTTDYIGVAQVVLTLGQHTADNPGIWLEKGTTYSQQVGENIVDAAIKSGATIASPFTAVAKAGAPDHFIPTLGVNAWGEILNWGGPVGLIVADQYGNSIANQPVTFTAKPPVNLAACDNPGADLGPALLAAEDEPCVQNFPTYGSGCGSTSLTTISDYQGTHAQVILGPMPGALYRITAQAGKLTTSFDWRSWPEVDCKKSDPPMFMLRVSLQYQSDQFGNLIDAGPVGGQMPVKAGCMLLQENGTGVGDGTYYLDNSKISKVVLSPPPLNMAGNGQGMYVGDYTLPAEPGMNELKATCSAELNGYTTTVYDTMQVAGVEVRFPYQANNPDPAQVILVAVNEQGYLTRDQALSYQILPAEYKAGSAYLFVYKDGESVFITPTDKTGIGFATLARGMWLEPGGDYEAEVVLNPGGGVEIRSAKVPLRVITLELDADLNGDGIFDEDDPQEYTSPGLIVLLNRNDDNGNKHVDLEDMAKDNVDSNGNRVLDPDLIKVELKGLPDDLETGSMFLELVAGQEQLRIWDSPDKLHLLLEPWADSTTPPDSNPMVIWPLGGGFNIGKLPKEIYLEGVKESQLSGEVQLRAGYLPPDGGEAVETDRLAITVVNVEMHVDEDRSGTISFYQPGDGGLVGDEKYTFWLNNDFDTLHHEESEWHEDDVDNTNTGQKNSDDIYIGYKYGPSDNPACKRDLEDFAMLQLRVPVWLKDLEGVKYSLKFKDGVTGNPAINLFEAVNDRQRYLEKDPVANDQILKTRLNTKPISHGDEFEIPRALVDKDGLVAPFIFEGVSEGSGELGLTVKIDGVALAQSSVTLELHDIKWFYDEYLAKKSGTRWEASISNIAPNIRDGQAAYAPKTNEYLLFVHGWNMSGEWEKQRWTETIFKRLWWLGYQGGVGLFSWESEPPISGYLDLSKDPVNFNNSEFKAWQASTALAGVMKDLKTTGHKLGVLAHSQGNVVTGEALRKYDGPMIDTYIASQAALSASLYDNNLPPSAQLPWSFFFNYPTILGVPDPVGLALQAQSSLTTPDIYGHFSTGQPPDTPYFADIQLHVCPGSMFNFYNGVDFALTGKRWELNNSLKPTNSPPYLFGYLGSSDSYDELSDHFFSLRDPFAPLTVTNENLKYQIFAYCAQSQTRALGTQAVAGGFKNLNLQDAPYEFTKYHYSHSRQFRSNLVAEYPYWETVRNSMGFGTSIKEESK